MNGIVAIATIVAAGVAAWLLERRRARRHVLAQETLRCPLYGGRAIVSLEADPHACAGRRYRDVAGCSLLPPPRFTPPTRVAGLSEVASWPAYPCGAVEPPALTGAVACSKLCVTALNAAEVGSPPLTPLQGGAWDLASRTQPPRIMRAMLMSGV
jgi:hypothetical protein